MKAATRASIVAMACLLGMTALGMTATADDRTPSSVVGYANLGASPHDSPDAVLGRPTTQYRSLSGPGSGDFFTSMVVGSYNTDFSGNKVITTIEAGGHITVKFDRPIEDDPANWYRKEFIVFGNAFFFSTGTPYVSWDTDMELRRITTGTSGYWEPTTVSVSQDNVNWYTYSSGPYVDDFAPTQAYTWDREVHNWDLELDWTKPIDDLPNEFGLPKLSKGSFAGKSVADAIDLYNGSAGGTAFDLASLPLPTNAQGRKWIQYIRVNGTGGEVDAISRVSHVPDPTLIADAKRLPDGASVRLAEGIVTASKSELGDCLYIESPDRTSGIKITGRTIDSGRRVIVGGVMATVNGERKLKAISVDDLGEGSVAPVGMTCKSLATGVSGFPLHSNPETPGVGTGGLLVRVWGHAGSIDAATGAFTIDDGSGVHVKCIPPAGTYFEPPVDGAFVTVTGISTTQLDEQSRLVPVLRLRSQTDLQ